MGTKYLYGFEIHHIGETLPERFLITLIPFIKADTKVPQFNQLA
jgi:hypothetical protein